MKKLNRLSRISRKRNETVFTSPLFNIRISDGEKEPRFGFVVSKKISMSAVLRNKTKRILRSAAEDFVDKVSLGKDIVIVSKKKLEWDQKQEVSEEMIASFKKAKILK